MKTDNAIRVRLAGIRRHLRNPDLTDTHGIVMLMSQAEELEWVLDDE